MAQAYILLTRKRLHLDKNAKIYEPRQRVREGKERRKDKLTRVQETGHQRWGARTRETVRERQGMRARARETGPRDGVREMGHVARENGHARQGTRDGVRETALRDA